MMEYKEPEYDQMNQEPEYDNPKRNSDQYLKIAIVILLLALLGLGAVYFKSVKKTTKEKEYLQVDLDTLKNQTQRLMADFEVIQFDNDTLNQNLSVERFKADSLMTRLTKERSISYSKLKQYERELGTLRVTMQGFVRQIDSLDRLNRKLTGENIQHKRDISELKIKYEVAEETAQELNVKVKRGSQIKVGKINISALNKNNKDARNAKQTTRLVVSFDLTSNELAQPGERNVFVRIISPEGYDLQETQGATFNFEGYDTPYAAVRSVDYQGDNLPVSVYYSGSGLTSGKYTIYVYMDGVMIGTTNIILN